MIASACDHYTRVVQGGTLQPKDSTVVGILFGTRSQNGSMSINDTTDIITEIIDHIERVPSAEIEKKIRLWTAVYTQYELLGWYTFGMEATPAHFALHDSIAPFAKTAPVFLLFNTVVSKADIDKIPLKSFLVETINDRRVFVECQFRTVSYEVEKIAVNEITTSIPREGLTKLEVQNQSMHTSLKILDGKIDTMISVLEQMRDGKIKVDHDLLRSTQKICKALQATDTDKDLHQELNKQVSDSMLISYLGAVHKGNKDWKEVNDVHEFAFERHHK